MLNTQQSKDDLYRVLEENPSGLFLYCWVWKDTRYAVVKNNTELDVFLAYIEKHATKTKTLHIVAASQQLLLKTQLTLSDLQIFLDNPDKDVYFKTPGQIFLNSVEGPEGLWEWFLEYKDKLVELYFKPDICSKYKFSISL